MSKPKTPRETQVIATVVGYHQTTRWSVNDGETNIPVMVRITGTGPDGKLKGLAYVYPLEVQVGWNQKTNIELRGDGQYSFMHGTSSLHWHDHAALTADIRQKAQAAADDYVQQNPNALLEYKIQRANMNLVEANSRENQAIHSLAKARQDVENWKTVLAMLKNQDSK